MIRFHLGAEWDLSKARGVVTRSQEVVRDGSQLISTVGGSGPSYDGNETIQPRQDHLPDGIPGPFQDSGARLPNRSDVEEMGGGNRGGPPQRTSESELRRHGLQSRLIRLA